MSDISLVTGTVQCRKTDNQNPL